MVKMTRAVKMDVCRVHVSARLTDAMWSLERSGAEIALVVDGEGRLLGTMTDGDIRRALLHGAALDSAVESHMRREFTFVRPGTSRAEVLDLMQARTLGQIPTVDTGGHLVGLHLLHEVLGAVERPNWAVVMAGGKGSRLQPLTEHVPKPMIRVAGRPILERIVLHLVSFGIRRIFLAINYLGHLIEEHFKDGRHFGCTIEYLREAHPLGTGGALSLLTEAPADPLIVMNGDLVTQADLGAMLEMHARHDPCATIGVLRYFHTVPFGCVELDGSRIVRMEEKPSIGSIVNAGIYVLRPDLVARVPRGEEFPITTLLERSLAGGERLLAFEIQDDWIDVGQREQLRKATRGEE